MAQSLAKIYVHLVFSTKMREPLISDSVATDLHAYMAGILNNLHCVTVQIGGVTDHVHILFQLARTTSLSEAVEEVKKGSSKWMKTKGVSTFSWQSGYGAFSVSESAIKNVVLTSKTKRNIIVKIRFRMSLESCYANVGLRMMRNICGIRCGGLFRPYRAKI